MEPPSPPQSGADSGGISRLREMYADLTDREQMLLKAMLGVFAVLAVAVVVGLVQQSIGELEEETAQYRTALNLIAEQGPAYVETQREGEDPDQVTRADLFTDEVLEDNTVQLTSSVASHAEAVGVSVSSYDTDEQPIGGDDEGPLIIERQLTVDIRGAGLEQFLELLHRLEESREPMVIKRLDVRSVREPGNVRALLVVATYQYGDEEES